MGHSEFPIMKSVSISARVPSSAHQGAPLVHLSTIDQLLPQANIDTIHFSGANTHPITDPCISQGSDDLTFCFNGRIVRGARQLRQLIEQVYNDHETMHEMSSTQLLGWVAPPRQDEKVHCFYGVYSSHGIRRFREETSSVALCV